MLNGIHFDVARKVAKQKTELIDLDLIRGSAFSKAKSKQSWLTSTYFGVVRVCLFPFYLRWWTDQSSRAVSIGLLILWALQASAMFVYFSCDQLNDSDKFQTIPLSELIGPLVMFFILGSIHSQISAGTLMSLKNKHLTKNPVPSTTNNSNGIGSIRTFKLDTKDESLRRSSNVNSSSAATDNHQTTDQPSNGTMSNVLHNVSHCFNLNQKPTLLLPDESNMLQLNSRGKKAKFVTKPNVLRKRKKMLASARSLMVTNNGSTDDCSMLISADITSCEDLSPYSTFHGQLNDRLDHLLACENSQQVLLDEEDEDDDEDELQSARTRGSLRIPIVSHNSTKMKSAHSSTSASLSNFSTDASGCRTALRSTDFAGKRSKETQCELGSSSESDRGMPPSPIKLLNDWPMINSDCSSDEDDDDDDDDDDDEDDNEEDEDVDDIENVNESKQLAEQLADGRTKVESGNYAFGFDPYDDGRSDLRRSTKALDQDNETDLKFATNRPRTRSRTIDSELNSNVRGRNPCLINDKKDHGNCKSANCKEDSQLPSLNTKNDQSDQSECRSPELYLK